MRCSNLMEIVSPEYLPIPFLLHQLLSCTRVHFTKVVHHDTERPLRKSWHNLTSTSPCPFYSIQLFMFTMYVYQR